MTKTTTTTTTPIEHPSITKLREELGEIELTVLTGFTLGDAMREGASVSDQKFGGWVDSNTSCALGAAFLSAKARGFIA